MTNPDDTALTLTELHALQQVVDCVQSGRVEEARWWAERETVIAALGKMRAAAKAAVKEAV